MSGPCCVVHVAGLQQRGVVRRWPATPASGAVNLAVTDGETSEDQDDLSLVEKVSKFPFSGNAGVAECPNCSAAVPFRRSLDPVIDSCGFEAYTLVCPACGHSFSGIIDPADDAFLPHDVRR